MKELLDSGLIGKPLTVDIRCFREPSVADLHPVTHTWRVKKTIGGEGYFYDMEQKYSHDYVLLSNNHPNF